MKVEGRESEVSWKGRNLRVCMVAYTFYERDNRVMRYAETLACYAGAIPIVRRLLGRSDRRRSDGSSRFPC